MKSVRYLPPFAAVKQKFILSSSNGSVVASVEYEALRNLISLLLQSITFDEEWYLRQYPDVAQAIAEKLVPSARAHFVNDGYFEGRLPFELEVDGDWYAETYDDVSKALAEKEIASPDEHFKKFGYAEGRLPGALG